MARGQTVRCGEPVLRLCAQSCGWGRPTRAAPSGSSSVSSREGQGEPAFLAATSPRFGFQQGFTECSVPLQVPSAE